MTNVYRNSNLKTGKLLSRQDYLLVVDAALAVRQYRFAREAVLNWLAVYPGDLGAGLFYAKSLMAEGLNKQAYPILEGLCAADPEFVQAAELWLQARNAVAADFQQPALKGEKSAGGFGAPLPERPHLAIRSIRTYVYALTGRGEGDGELWPWGRDLYQARRALADGRMKEAEELIRSALSSDPQTALACVTHLHFLRGNPRVSLEIRQKLAGRYERLWPECLACTLMSADWALEAGDSASAVSLLHQASARDISAQVPQRIWGADQPYRDLWPKNLELPLILAPPAPVIAFLGWNQLAAQVDSGTYIAQPEAVDPEPVSAYPEAPVPAADEAVESPVAAEPAPAQKMVWSPAIPAAQDKSSALPPEETASVEEVAQAAAAIPPVESVSPAAPVQPGVEDPVKPAKSPNKAANIPGAFADFDIFGQVGDPEKLTPAVTPVDSSAPQQEPPKKEIEPRQKSKSNLSEALIGLEQIGERQGMPGLTRLDGRFPVYVVFSVRSNLASKYGARSSERVVAEMERLVQTIQRKPRWGARLFMPDDPNNVTAYGIKPARPHDPWSLKLALADLDAALSAQGEMIGAVLIVGGADVVPFHQLPNPVDDQDDFVSSDNPYATRDENYFVPEWPLGRLPGDSGDNPELLVGMLQTLRKRHAARGNKVPWYRRIWSAFLAWLQIGKNGGGKSFGYTAAIWRRAAASVYRPIGNPRQMHVSPPRGHYDGDFLNPTDPDEAQTGLQGGVPLPQGSLGYFNLHGVVDASAWYGQRDPFSNTEGPDYPIALRPHDIEFNGKGSQAPKVVFSEACYGVHLDGRSADQAISLRFLQVGSQAVVGSTCMAYGSVETPLIAADLLGHTFWRMLQDGMPAGEALRQAKIHLASEMDRRQGYLDGEDQKTLISFSLYGDPLAYASSDMATHKGVTRLASSPVHVKTVCDRATSEVDVLKDSVSILSSVRDVVSRYLPGMEDARVAVAEQRSTCVGKGHKCPTSDLCQQKRQVSKMVKKDGGSHHLVTLSKQVPRADGTHAHYARLTLDEGGKLLKLVVSR